MDDLNSSLKSEFSCRSEYVKWAKILWHMFWSLMLTRQMKPEKGDVMNRCWEIAVYALFQKWKRRQRVPVSDVLKKNGGIFDNLNILAKA